jgi:hypothetical protein
VTSEHERTRAVEAVERIVNRGGEEVDVLRDVLEVLLPLYEFVAIRFVDGGRLVEGPSLGTRDGGAARFPIEFLGVRVAELEVGTPAEEERAVLERVATLIAGYCLAWDTRGEP